VNKEKEQEKSFDRNFRSFVGISFGKRGMIFFPFDWIKKDFLMMVFHNSEFFFSLFLQKENQVYFEGESFL